MDKNVVNCIQITQTGLKMQSTIIHQSISNVQADKYVNSKTGETMDSEIESKERIQKKAPTGTFEINSDNYVTFDDNAVKYLLKTLNRTDVSRVFQMGNMTRTDCSVISHPNNKPHTSESLAEVLGMSMNKFYAMIRTMVKENILLYMVCAPTGFVRKIYILNPYIARKKRAMNCELLMAFCDVTLDMIPREKMLIMQIGQYEIEYRSTLNPPELDEEEMNEIHDLLEKGHKRGNLRTESEIYGYWRKALPIVEKKKRGAKK